MIANFKKLSKLLIALMIIFLLGCATHRSKQFVIIDQDQFQKELDIKPELYAFLGTWKYSKQEAEARIDFFLKFEDPFMLKREINGLKADEVEILIDSVFVTFPSGERKLVMEQHGKEIFSTKTSSYKIGKIIIPNDVKGIVLNFNLKVIDKPSSTILRRHKCEVTMKRKESSYLFMKTI